MSGLGDRIDAARRNLEAALSPGAPDIDEALRRARRRRAVAAAFTALAIVAIALSTWAALTAREDGGRVVTGPSEVDPTTPTEPSEVDSTTTTELESALPEGPPVPPGPGLVACPVRGQDTRAANEQIQRFFDAVVTGADPPPMGAEVAAQLESARQERAVERFTNDGYRVVTPEIVEVCTDTYERLDGRLQVSVDGIAAALTPEGWRIERWVRGDPRPIEDTEVIRVPFYPHGASCADRDFVVAEVEVPSSSGSPGVLAYHALVEVLSGPAGRIDATTAIPADVRHVGTPVVEFGVADVHLYDTAQELDACQGAAARDQIAEAIRLALEQAGEPSYDVMIRTDGEALTALGQ